MGREGFTRPIPHQSLGIAFRRLGKRGGEIAGALACLIAFAPLLTFAAIAIKLDTTGPVFVRERRYGHKGHAFLVCKFRTRACRDEHNAGELTAVGHFLKQTGIEDLPMLANVLTGEMSIIGLPPRISPAASPADRKPGIIPPGRW